MNPAEVLEGAITHGLRLSISADENIRILGDQKIIDEWLPLIREHKSEIIFLLRREQRQKHVMEMLASNPGVKYFVVAENSQSDPVLLTIGIRGMAIFEMHVPLKNYDGVALLQVIEQYAEECGNTQASTDEKKRSLGLPDERKKTA
jgi:hypothetical protein